MYLYSRSNITVISYSLPDAVVKNKVFDEFTKGKKITGEFTPKENYLGQFLLRFYTYNRINIDSIDFKIKEKGQSSWYYEHVYKTDQFLPDNLFTFGFPPIADSRGKNYVFEIESIDGTPDESVTLSKIEPLSALSFQYPKTLLIKNPSLAMSFMVSKFKYLDLNRELVIQFLIYLNFISLMLILEYILLEKIFAYRFEKAFNSQNIIVLGLLVMMASSILYYLKKEELSLNITVVSYLVLVLGVIYAVWEAIKSKSSR